MSEKEAAALPAGELAEVLRAWVKAGKAELPQALAASADKAVARAAKKALYQLKSSGVAVAEAAAARPGAAPSAPEEERASDELASGILSHVLGTGERALFFARPKAGGGLELFQCILHDELGLQQLDRAESNRAAFRKRLKEVRSQKEPVLIVDLERVKRELGRAWQRNVEAHVPLPRDAEVALRRLEVQPIEGQEPLPPPEPGDDAAAARGALLFDEPELAQWLPPEAHIRVLAQRVQEVEASPLTLSPAQKQQQLEARVEATAREFLTPAMRALYARRLWASAEIFEATGREASAQLCRSTARSLAAGAAPGPFVHRFFARVIELSAAAGKAGKPTLPAPAAPAPGRLIVP